MGSVRLSRRVSPRVRVPGRHHTCGQRIVPRLRPLVLDLGCCSMSALELASPIYGLPGNDGRWYDLAPDQANVLIVAGRITPACSTLVQALYAQLAPPRWSVACGACALTGSPLGVIPVSDLLPVDVEVAGCPPRPDDLCRALAQLPARWRR